MKMHMRERGPLLLFFLLPALISSNLSAQPAARLIDHFPELNYSTGEAPEALFTLQVNGEILSSAVFEPDPDGSFIHASTGIRSRVEEIPGTKAYACRMIRFFNESADTLELENLLPLGASAERPYIIPYGPPGLTRSTLFRPGKGPVGLIVPDNAWELGFTILEISPSGRALLDELEQASLDWRIALADTLTDDELRAATEALVLLTERGRGMGAPEDHEGERRC